MRLPQSLLGLISAFSKLPSIGEKSAQRLAYFIVSRKPEMALELSEALNKAVSSISICDKCGNLIEDGNCLICTNLERDNTILCIVEKTLDLIAIEKIGGYRGHYHVLHYLWSPIKGIGTEKLNLEKIISRINHLGVKEVILALNSTVEGDATVLYIANELKALNLKVTRLAQGLPKGGEIEYIDETTISRAILNRLEIN